MMTQTGSQRHWDIHVFTIIRYPGKWADPSTGGLWSSSRSSAPVLSPANRRAVVCEGRRATGRPLEDKWSTESEVVFGSNISNIFSMMNLDIITVITFTTQEHYIIWIYIYTYAVAAVVAYFSVPAVLHSSSSTHWRCCAQRPRHVLWLEMSTVRFTCYKKFEKRQLWSRPIGGWNWTLQAACHVRHSQCARLWYVPFVVWWWRIASTTWLLILSSTSFMVGRSRMFYIYSPWKI